MTFTHQKALQIDECSLPTRRFLRLEQAANYLGVSVDTFKGIGVPHCELTKRISVWDVEDITSFVHNRRCDDSARTSVQPTQRKRQKCVSKKEEARRSGGSHGTTRTESDIAEVLELKTAS